MWQFLKKLADKDFDQIDYNFKLLLSEAVARGAEIKIDKESGTTVVNFQGQKALLFGLTLGTTSFTSAWLAGDKYYSKKLLEYLGVSTPKGRVFDINDVSEIKSYAKDLGFPVVIKPLTESHGLGVYSGISSIATLSKALKFLKAEMTQNTVLVEEHIEGKEYRLFVTRRGFLAAVNRVPANVIGDGKHNIKQLVAMENYKRMNPRKNCLCTIKIDNVVKEYLRKNGVQLTSVPNKSEKVFLCQSSNVARGGNCYDVTDQVHSSIRDFAFKTLKMVSGLNYLGIDLICPDITKPLNNQKHAVCELNCSPGLSLHTVPESGIFRDTPKAVFDIMF